MLILLMALLTLHLDFGETDTNGQWKPKTSPSVTYGTNGFFLKFANSGSLGTDSSGNGNNFTQSGSGDQVTDTPDNVFATWNPLNGIGTFSEGNVKYNTGTSGSRSSTSTMGVSSGKWYSEIKITSSNGNQHISIVSDAYNSLISTSRPYSFSDGVSYSASNGNKWIDGTSTSYGATYTTNDIIGIALNLDDDEITFYKNGTSQGTITGKTFDNNTNYLIAIGNGSSGSSPIVELNTGNPSFSITSGNTDDNGYGNFEYAPPTGYLALCTKNLAETLTLPIGDSSVYFQTALYTGNGTAIGSGGLTITNDGHSDLQPDWIWFKKRSGAESHAVGDSTRGSLGLFPDLTQGESSGGGQFIDSFNTDGFTVGNVGWVNDSGQTYVAWQWKANDGTTSSNTDGSITSTVQANTTSGFSIVTYTGDAGTGSTVGHGLGVAPKVVIVKPRDGTTAYGWRVYTEMTGNTNYLNLNATDASAAFTDWNNTSPTPSVFTVNSSSPQTVNESGTNYVAYCFAEIEGYSKFGSYTGNITSGTDGTFVYTGFRPSLIIVKCTSTAGQEWVMFDSKRDSYNVATKWLYPNANTAENGTADQRDVDLLSNGFKFRNAGGPTSYSGRTYIYMAFAEHPFVDSTGRPVTAR